MSTCCLSNDREAIAQVEPPRAVFVKWPMGSPVGEPGNVAQQRRIVCDLLEAVRGMSVSGTIVDLGYRWRREDYTVLPGLSLG